MEPKLEGLIIEMLNVNDVLCLNGDLVTSGIASTSVCFFLKSAHPSVSISLSVLDVQPLCSVTLLFAKASLT